MELLAMLSGFAQFATSILPMVAAARSQSDPSVSNAALINTAKAIQIAAPIVNHIESVSNSGQKMSGADKLDLALQLAQEYHNNAVSTGTTNATFEQWWPVLNTAITAVCASQKSSNSIRDSFISGT